MKKSYFNKRHFGILFFSEKESNSMWESFRAFNINATNNFLYMLTSNFWFLFLLVGVIGTIILLLKEQIDTSARDEQNII